jgi:hypothetical protein
LGCVFEARLWNLVSQGQHPFRTAPGRYWDIQAETDDEALEIEKKDGSRPLMK